MAADLFKESVALLSRIRSARDACFTDHPRHGLILIPGMERRQGRLRQIEWRANRRHNRRMARLGLGLPMGLAWTMRVINDRSSTEI